MTHYTSGRIELWVPAFAYIVECYATKRCGDVLHPDDCWRPKTQGQEGDVKPAYQAGLRMIQRLVAGGLSPSAALVYVTILWKAGSHLQRPVSMQGVAWDLGMSRQTVSAHVQSLIKHHMLFKLAHVGPHGNRWWFALWVHIAEVLAATPDRETIGGFAVKEP